MHVDHNHRTGKVRALLCHSCNVALGAVDDNRYRLQDILNYLNRHEPAYTASGIKSAPSPFGKTDSELAQEYRNWFWGPRIDELKAAELSQNASPKKTKK